MSGTAPGYVVGIDPGFGAAPVEGEIQILVSSPRKWSSCQGMVLDKAVLLQNIQEVVVELGKTKTRAKPAPSGAVDEKYPKVQRGVMGKRSGRELMAPFLDLQVV